jgi:hypothetical protein
MNITLEHDGREFTNFTVEDLLAAGVPQAAIDAALNKVRVDKIKQECRRRIYAVASAETQMNLAAASAVISGKTAANRTDPEKAVLAAAEAAIDWVAGMRINIASLAANPTSDFKDDANWPVVPDEVAAVMDQF